MSKQSFHFSDEPSALSVSMLVRNLRDDSNTKGVSPKIYAHRSRVIRQQTELLTLQAARDVDEGLKAAAKRTRKASRELDHREEGGQG